MIRRPPTLSQGAQIVASHPLAAHAGAAVLQAGGHAVEALIAAGAVLSVVEPSASGIGGDAFFLVHDREDDAVSAVNGSGAAPRALRPDADLRGPLAFTVPCCVAAWHEASEAWGRLEWGDLLEPAIALAREGFPLSWRMARVLRTHGSVLREDPQLARLYLDAGGAPARAGARIRNPKLADTLEAIASGGAVELYEGEIAARFCAGVLGAGGVLAPEDLAEHESDLRGAVETPFGDRVLCEQPLPSQGVLLPILLALAGADAPPEARALERPWEILDRQLRARRLAFVVRSLFLGDPRFLPVPEDDLVGALLDRGTLDRLVGLLRADPDRARARQGSDRRETDASADLRRGEEVELPGGKVQDEVRKVVRELAAAGGAWPAILRAYERAGLGPAEDGSGGPAAQGSDTTYLCAVDTDGNVAGLIQSIFQPFGSGFVEPATGILLNNRATGFSRDPRSPNRLEPGKRALHTLNSYMVLEAGKPWMVGGTPGADNQISTNLQVLAHLSAGRILWPGPMPMQPGKWTQARRLSADRTPLEDPELLAAAIEAPRWFVTDAGRPAIESRMPGEVRRRFDRFGHEAARVGPWDGSGLVQAIRILEGGVLCGATDPRGEGLAIGF